MGFNDMKKSSGINKSLLEELNKISSGSTKSYQDDRFWKPERDKADNGFAIVRFLPAVDGEDVPFVRIFNHGFKGVGGWMIENCPTTIGLTCPVCEANSELWNSGVESDKDIARNRKRKLQYIANIMVVSDPKNPQNEGKVFLYKFGKKIFDKVNESMNPEFEDEEAINPFD
ncbi:MAG TPA: single-stranded DNA-binding protein, partial [Cytophagales bacterium]|nr:single-stranded DNA-binding protein [Cytophagales bacterium]